jgi:hypothetical protein
VRLIRSLGEMAIAARSILSPLSYGFAYTVPPFDRADKVAQCQRNDIVGCGRRLCLAAGLDLIGRALELIGFGQTSPPPDECRDKFGHRRIVVHDDVKA